MDAERLVLPPFSYHPYTWRSQGTHLTEVRDWLAVKLGYQKEGGDFAGWELAGSVGFLFEDAIGALLPGLWQGENGVELVRGVELECDGIAMSPDGIHPATNEPWDFKFTWKSVDKTPPERNWAWGVQLGSYAHALDVESAVVVALYCCGNYKPPQPQLVVTRLVWTKEELAANWRMITKAREAMERERIGT